MNTFAELKEETDAAVVKLKKDQSRKFKRRATWLIKKLAKHFPITGVSMGMGVYSLTGEKFDVEEEGVPDYQLEIDELLEWVAHEVFEWQPKGVTDDHRRWLHELSELLEYVNDPENVVDVFDIEINVQPVGAPRKRKAALSAASH